MIIKKLKIKGIGPFEYEELEFISNNEQLKKPPVIIITGENGTGKSIILDSIRLLFMGVFDTVERNIISSKDFLIESDILLNDAKINLKSTTINNDNFIQTNLIEVNKLFVSSLETKYKKNFIFEYWTSKLSNDNFNIKSIEALSTKNYLDESLRGVHKNIDVTKIISFFDYLKDSRDTAERELGASVFNILEKIINTSINEGKLSHVSRIDLTPIITVRNKQISLDKLSSGNIYLIQRLLSLLRQVYSICVINNLPISEYKKIKGVLLIDEAENHLHPKWQKVFLKNILDLFPNIQIIVSTHSPFIVSSIENSKVFVCESKTDFSTIIEETDFYSNKPVEEILMSPLFNTNNFNIEISELLKKRKSAIQSNNQQLAGKIEEELTVLNPGYFNYFKIDELINSIKK